MSKDRLMLNPLWLGEDLNVESLHNVLDSVPVSKFRPYLEATFGQRIPSSESDIRAAADFFNVAAAYSTDESLTAIIDDDNLTPAQKVATYIPRWLQFTESLVDVTTTLRKASDEHLAPYKNNVVPMQYDYEMTYMTGLFYAGTQLCSVALDIPHPSQTHPGLIRPGQYKGVIVGGIAEEPLPQTILLDTPVVKMEHRKQVEVLKARTTVLNSRAMNAALRVISITQTIQARKELHTLLGE